MLCITLITLGKSSVHTQQLAPGSLGSTRMICPQTFTAQGTLSMLMSVPLLFIPFSKYDVGRFPGKSAGPHPTRMREDSKSIASRIADSPLSLDITYLVLGRGSSGFLTCDCIHHIRSLQLKSTKLQLLKHRSSPVNCFLVVTPFNSNCRPTKPSIVCEDGVLDGRASEW